MHMLRRIGQVLAMIVLLPLWLLIFAGLMVLDAVLGPRHMEL